MKINYLKTFKLKNFNRYIYLSRNSNVIGYRVLKSLISQKLPPLLVLLPKKEKKRNIEYKKIFFKSSNNLEPIEILAKKNKIKVIRVKSINSKYIYHLLKKLNLDYIFIGGGWPKILSKEIFELPKFFSINTHPSYLPRYRGADVHRWQIIKGEKIFGITFHIVNKYIDCGKIILQKKIKLYLNCPNQLIKVLSNLAFRYTKILINKKLNISKNNKVNILKNKKKQIIYKKWKWKNEKFFFVKPKQYLNLENFSNAAKNIPNNFNGPFIVINKKKIVIRDAKILIKKNISFNKKNYKLYKNCIILKTKYKNKVCIIKKI